MATARTDAVIAGVNKAGTTSLFVSLSTHPAVAPSSIKETRYFLPARYGNPLPPIAEWESYFRDQGSRPVRLESTPSYFYGAPVAPAIAATLTNPHVIVAFREPVSRAISFFAYQKARLRLPVDLPIADYFAAADRLTPDDFLDPANERYMAFRGGCYADYLPAWLDTFGPDRLRVVAFEALLADPAPEIVAIATWLGLDSAAFPEHALSSENRTTGYKSKTMQRVALLGNDRLERVLRRHPEMKRRLRALYYRVNGKVMQDEVPETLRAELAERYQEPNARLARQLTAAGITRPPWLADPEGRSAEAHEQAS